MEQTRAIEHGLIMVEKTRAIEHGLCCEKRREILSTVCIKNAFSLLVFQVMEIVQIRLQVKKERRVIKLEKTREEWETTRTLRGAFGCEVKQERTR